MKTKEKSAADKKRTFIAVDAIQVKVAQVNVFMKKEGFMNQVYYVIDLKATGERIRELRLISGLTVRFICDCVGIENEVSYYKWQRGDCLPSIDHLVVLSVLFGVTIDDILVVVKVGGRDEGEQEAPLPCYLWAGHLQSV